MNDPLAWLNLLPAVLSAVFAAGGAWFAVRTELKFLRRDVDRNSVNIEKLEERRHDDSTILHDRISRLSERVTKTETNGPQDRAG